MHSLPIYFEHIKKYYPQASFDPTKIMQIEIVLGTFTLDIRELQLSNEPSEVLNLQYFLPLTFLAPDYTLQITHLQLCNLINMYLPYGAVGIDYKNMLFYWKYSETITKEMNIAMSAQKNKMLLDFTSTLLSVSHYSFNAIIKEGFSLEEGLKDSNWESLL